MIDSEFRIVLWLIIGIAVLTGTLALLGMIFHVAIFGTMFGMILKGLRDSSKGHPVAPRCAHCGSNLPTGVTVCPGCGAPGN